MTYTNNYDQIERYLSNDMEEAELILFERELLKNLDLLAELRFHLYVDCHIAHAVYPALLLPTNQPDIDPHEEKAMTGCAMEINTSLEQTIHAHGGSTRYSPQGKIILSISLFILIVTDIFIARPKQFLISKTNIGYTITKSN